VQALAFCLKKRQRCPAVSAPGNLPAAAKIGIQIDGLCCLCYQTFVAAGVEHMFGASRQGRSADPRRHGSERSVAALPDAAGRSHLQAFQIQRKARHYADHPDQ
jgi:hypothetical protein